MPSNNGKQPKILILATLSGGYRGADAAGQSHMDYPPNTYVLPVMTAALFPADFYIQSFEKGFDAILVMYSGTDSPFKGAPERTAEVVNEAYEIMKTRDWDLRRLKLAAICTVCVRPFLEEINNMNNLLAEIGSLPRTQAVTA